MVFYFYLFIFLLNIGLFRIPARPVYVVSYVILFVLTLPAYLHQRKVLVKHFQSFRVFELTLICFLAYFSIRILFDESDSKWGSVVNLMEVLPYGIFFPTVAVLNNIKNVNTFVKFGLMVAIIGSFLCLAQSFYGLSPMFNIEWYHTGAWSGNKDMLGPFARVNLPISSWIIFCFLWLVTYSLAKLKPSYILMSSIFFAVILLAQFRSLWLALTLSLSIEVFIYAYFFKDILKTSYKFFFILLLIVTLLFFMLKIIGGHQLLTEFSFERLGQGYYDVLFSSGTFGSRLLTMTIGQDLLEDNFWFGSGYMFYYYGNMPFLVDVGYIYVSVLLGVVGLTLVLTLFVSQLASGCELLRLKMFDHNNPLTFLPLATIGYAMTLFIYQHWLIPYSTPNIAIAMALSFNFYSLKLNHLDNINTQSS